MALLERSGAAASPPPDASIAEAVLDPYVNAIHVSLLREKRLNPDYRQALAPRWGLASPRCGNWVNGCSATGPEAISGR